MPASLSHQPGATSPVTESPAAYRFQPGDAPLLISIPHLGTEIPPAILGSMTAEATIKADTDWHVDRLYDFAPALGIAVLSARWSRYVIDLNRDPDNLPLYAGANNTELCPTSTFDEAPLYPPGGQPDAAEIARRREVFWRPYHQRLETELKRLVAKHGVCVLWEAHSIRSVVPRFFQGRLPDLNFGTANGASAAPDLMDRVATVAAGQGTYSHVVNGRFKGGYITRAYGKPAAGVHAIQLEKAQVAYMDETPPFAWRAEKADRLKALLRPLIETALGWARERATGT